MICIGSVVSQIIQVNLLENETSEVHGQRNRDYWTRRLRMAFEHRMLGRWRYPNVITTVRHIKSLYHSELDPLSSTIIQHLLKPHKHEEVSNKMKGPEDESEASNDHRSRVLLAWLPSHWAPPSSNLKTRLAWHLGILSATHDNCSNGLPTHQGPQGRTIAHLCQALLRPEPPQVWSLYFFVICGTCVNPSSQSLTSSEWTS